MKKLLYLFFIVLTVSICVTGCGKKGKEKDDNNLTGGWQIELIKKASVIPDAAKQAFEDAVVEYDGMDFKLIALLGEQVVAGKNYMFLCEGTPVVPDAETKYVVVIVYKNIEDKSVITNVADFDYTEYTYKENIAASKTVVGGWYTTVPDTGVELDKDIKEAYDNAIATLEEGEVKSPTYLPIGVLGKQVVSGTNYAIIAYGTLGEKNNIYVITLYEDLDGNSEILSSATVNLADFNQ